MNKKNLIKQGDSRKPISKLLSLILIALIIFIVGCGGSDSGDIKVPDPDDNDLPNDEEFDEMTHTYDEYPFLGAYVFVDPGANGQFTDGYNNDKSATFRELLDRQFETLANEITYRLLSVYGDGTILEDSKSIDFGSTSYKVNINKNQAIDDAVGELPAEIPNNLPLLGEEATTTWTTILLCEDTDPEDIRNSFELTNAILGGHPAINDGDEIGFDTTSNIAGAKWKVAGLSNEEIIRKIKLALLNSVAGLENNLDGNIALETIDHLGFTENDKQNILNAIQSEILGSPALAYDLDNKEAIKNTILYT